MNGVTTPSEHRVLNKIYPGQSPFSLALKYGHRRTLKILLRAGAAVHTPDLREYDFQDETWDIVDAIRKAKGWPNYVTRRRATFATLIAKATRNKLPHVIEHAIAAFVEPPGGY